MRSRGPRRRYEWRELRDVRCAIKVVKIRRPFVRSIKSVCCHARVLIGRLWVGNWFFAG